MRHHIFSSILFLWNHAEAAPGWSDNLIDLGYATYRGTQNDTSG